MAASKTIPVCLVYSATLFAVSSTLTISPAQSISQTLLNASLNMDPNLTLRGRFGAESLPVIPMLMNAVSGLADLAYLDYDRRIPGFHVPNLPSYTGIDISIQPSAPATDVEVRFAVVGLYYIFYTMIMKKTFKNSDFGIIWNDVEVCRITINKRSRPSNQESVNANSTVVFGSQPISSLNDTAIPTIATGNTGLDYFFQYLDFEKISPTEVFLTVMATLKDIAKWPDTDIVKPFRSRALGVKAGIQFLELETPRTEPPFLLYGNLIDTIKQIPAYSLQNKRFEGLVIVISFGSDIIGELMLEDGS